MWLVVQGFIGDTKYICWVRPRCWGRWYLLLRRRQVQGRHLCWTGCVQEGSRRCRGHLVLDGVRPGRVAVVVEVTWRLLTKVVKGALEGVPWRVAGLEAKSSLATRACWLPACTECSPELGQETCASPGFMAEWRAVPRILVPHRSTRQAGKRRADRRCFCG